MSLALLAQTYVLLDSDGEGEGDEKNEEVTVTVSVSAGGDEEEEKDEGLYRWDAAPPKLEREDGDGEEGDLIEKKWETELGLPLQVKLEEVEEEEEVKVTVTDEKKRKKRSGSNWMWADWGRGQSKRRRKKRLTLKKRKRSKSSKVNPSLSQEHSQIEEDKSESEDNLSGIETEKLSKPLCPATIKNGADPVKKVKVEAFKCPYCLDVFLTANGLIEHLRKHNPGINSDIKPICQQGPAIRMTVPGVNRVRFAPIKTEETDPDPVGGQYKCRHCSFTSNPRHNLKRHLKLHTDPSRPWKCAHCSCAFNDAANLRTHENRLHNRKSGLTTYACSICKKKFRLSNLIAHMRIHTGKKPYQYPSCNDKFRELRQARNHLRMTHGKKSLSTSRLNALILSNPEQRRLAASEHILSQLRPCQVLLTRCDDLIPSLQSTSSPSIKLENIDRASLIRTHRHGRALTFDCTLCPKTFTDRSKALGHILIHTQERPCSCPTCGKSFRWKENLLVHQRIHTGERPYHCSLCGQTFGAMSNLKMHLLIHTGEKPHKCPTCQKRFRTTSQLIRHKMIHSGLRPYKCTICNQRKNR